MDARLYLELTDAIAAADCAAELEALRRRDGEASRPRRERDDPAAGTDPL